MVQLRALQRRDWDSLQCLMLLSVLPKSLPLFGHSVLTLLPSFLAPPSICKSYCWYLLNLKTSWRNQTLVALRQDLFVLFSFIRRHPELPLYLPQPEPRNHHHQRTTAFCLYGIGLQPVHWLVSTPPDLGPAPTHIGQSTYFFASLLLLRKVT